MLLLDPILGTGSLFSQANHYPFCAMGLYKGLVCNVLAHVRSSLSLYSGNSAVQAISLLVRKGVPESNIIFLNLISVS